MNTHQIELSLSQNQTRPGTTLRQQRRNRARWWFSQMRLVVENAIDWHPTPPAPPQQTQLVLSPGK